MSDRFVSPEMLHQLLPRNVYVECDTTKRLKCPDCTATEECQFIYPSSYTECPRAVCNAKTAKSTDSLTSSGPGTNVGAIAGGVVGGLVAIAVITYLVWRFCVRTRREPMQQDGWEEERDVVPDMVSLPRHNEKRASTHTVGSIASTVLTRASNIIQIAYIPGVTNRAATSPGLLVPPVPPIPSAHSQISSPVPSPAGTEDQHFFVPGDLRFVPGDLRDSTYSGLSGYTDRTSFARTSYAPRSSVASTIYGKIEPAQTGMMAKPAMVSVKSANSNGTSTPPVPAVDYDKYRNIIRPPSPANSTFSVGSTFLNNASAHTATPARAMVVRVGSVKKSTLTRPKFQEDSATSPSVSSSTMRDSNAATIIVDSPASDQGPFCDPPSLKSAQSTTSLSAVIEEATRRASQRDSSSPLKGRERSPFDDENAV
ncbi:hypothetical protein B0H63DRAFT_527990 [Podospora didyma]|uniref:Membrane anchor Opy2 N-terminal domain-containing protein n=1 Tax=Podospora didyma TaxID=330526 RepID=A0AAE0N499_9PEZI|nr:hypothetical protein B0H63DRAFT_527990 [Podospora didyma]